MLIKEIRPGRAIDIVIRREGYDYRLVSKVEDVRENMVFISLIASKNRVFMFKPTDKVEFIYKNEERMFIWKNVKGSISELDGERVHCLIAPPNGEAYNRRNAFRLYIAQEMYFTHYVPKQTDEEIERLPGDPPIEDDERYTKVRFISFVKNISENGIGIFSNELLKEGDKFSFDYKTKYGDMGCVARVSRITDEKEGSYKHFYGCVLEKADKRLGKYLFELQREKLKRQRG